MCIPDAYLDQDVVNEMGIELYFDFIKIERSLTREIVCQGRKWPVSEWKFYVAFSFFRGASIYAGIYNRWIKVS